MSHVSGEALASEQFKRTSNRDSGNNYSAMVSDMQVLFGELCLEISQTVARLDAQHAG